MAHLTERSWWSLGEWIPTVDHPHTYESSHSIDIHKPLWQDLHPFLVASELDDFAQISPVWRHMKATYRHRHSHSGKGVESWHHDGMCDFSHPRLTDQDADYYYYLVQWANQYPTEIQLPDKKVIHARPFEMIAFRNSTYTHRQPKLPDSVHRTESRRFLRITLLALGCPIYD